MERIDCLQCGDFEHVHVAALELEDRRVAQEIYVGAHTLSSTVCSKISRRRISATTFAWISKKTRPFVRWDLAFTDLVRWPRITATWCRRAGWLDPDPP